MQFNPKDLSELDDLTEEHLGFSALSDGLGFTKSPPKKNAKVDPAAGGVDKNEALRAKSLSGTGAVAAGPARMAYSAATARPTVKVAAQVLAEPAAPRWLRASAFLLDSALIFTPLALGWWASFRGQSAEIFMADFRPPLVLFAVIFSAYFLLSESFGGQSLGKMIFGLQVVEDDKYQKPTGLRHAASRLALFYFGAAALGLGFLASFWDSKRRPWHDRYTGSIVRKKS